MLRTLVNRARLLPKRCAVPHSARGVPSSMALGPMTFARSFGSQSELAPAGDNALDFKTTKAKAVEALDITIDSLNAGLSSDCVAYAKELGLRVIGVEDDIVTIERATKTHVWKIEFSLENPTEEEDPEAGGEEQENWDFKNNQQEQEVNEDVNEDEEDEGDLFDETPFSLTLTPVKQGAPHIQLVCRASEESDLLVDAVAFNPASEETSHLELGTLDENVREPLLDLLDSISIDSRLALYVQHVQANQREVRLKTQLSMLKSFAQSIQQ